MAKRLNALLPVMRWAVIGLAGAILIFSIIGLFRFTDYAARHLDKYTPNYSWTGLQVQQGLNELGLPPMTTAWFELGRDVVSLLLVYSIAAIILWKKSNDWFGILLMAVFIIIGPTGTLLSAGLESLPGLNAFVDRVLGAIAWQLFFLLFFFFPNGRPTPSWTGWFAAGYSVFMLAALEFDELNISKAGTFIGTLMVVLAVGSQVYRYLRRSDTIQRQQTKWVVSVLSFFVLLLPLIFLFGFQAPSAGNLGPALLKDFGIKTLFSLVFWLTPIAITIAVLRYRLWDIDLVIRRTLLYVALTATLGLVYFGSVLLLQQVFRALSGQDSPAGVVLSTLAIAALFTPLRRRFQAIIDRRFFRQKYDTARTLEAFSTAVRNEVNLVDLIGHLEKVVEETVQPEVVSLWLKKGR